MKKTMRQVDYAAHRGISKQRVSALKAQGRIVMDLNDQRRVDVAASDALLDATESGLPQHQARKGVAQVERAAKAAQAGSGDAGGQGGADSGGAMTLETAGRKLKEAQWRKAAADADTAEMERDRMRGDLVPITEVERTIADVFTVARLAFESLPDKFATQLAAETDEARVHALMAEEIAATLRHAADMLEQKAKQRGVK